jgi:NADPH:quinone reductase-like Zn-dependent oxidoreductase
MRAVGVTEFGGPGALHLLDVPEEHAGPGQVRLRVTAATVNPTDTHAVAGVYADRDPFKQPPWVPGMDVAGVVDEIGPGSATDLLVGDAAMAIVVPTGAHGGYRESLVLPANSVVRAPKGASDAEASTLPMNGLTAFVGLEQLGLDEGQTVVVTGGAGLLASFVIPTAKLRGLRVLADAKPEDEELVRSFGADEVLPRGDGFVDAVREAVPEGVDGVYDTALLGRSMFPAIREGGGLAYVRAWDGDDVEDGVTIHRVWVGDVVERTDWLRELHDLASRGVLQLRVAETYPPERAADAHRVMDAGGLRGRAVIVF